MNSGITQAAKLTFALFAIVLLVTLAGCGKDNPTKPPQNPQPTSTTYTGSVASNQDAGNGMLTITVQSGTPAPNGPGAHATATVTATGVFTPYGGGAAIALLGTYNLDDKTFTLTDGTWTFEGGLKAFGVDGSVRGPGVSGHFSLFSGASDIIVIVGTFTGTSSGNFNLAIKGSDVHGSAYQTGSVTRIPLDGVFYDGHIGIFMPATTAPPYVTKLSSTLPGSRFADGDYNPANDPDISNGFWNNGKPAPYHESGTWSGNKQ